MTDKLKLLPREATPEMLKAMDECSMEGYDERLYAGHAGSVYMAAWDTFHGQHCYCGDITNLGVIHRDDGPCHYPEHTSEYKRGYADAMNWKVQNHLEHLPAAQPEQEPVALQMDVIVVNLVREGINKHRARELAEHFIKHTTPPQRKPLTDDEFLELLLRDGTSEVVGYCTFVGGSIQMQGRVGLLRSAKVIKQFIEFAYGIKE